MCNQKSQWINEKPRRRCTRVMQLISGILKQPAVKATNLSIPVRIRRTGANIDADRLFPGHNLVQRGKIFSQSCSKFSCEGPRRDCSSDKGPRMQMEDMHRRNARDTHGIHSYCFNVNVIDGENFTVKITIEFCNSKRKCVDKYIDMFLLFYYSSVSYVLFIV